MFRRFNRSLKDKTGFTLAEIMIVVAIIGIISMIVIPNLSKMHDRGNIAQAKSNLRALQAAAENYYVHNGNTYPAQLSDLISAIPSIIGPDLPQDPFTSSDYGYAVSDNGFYYALYSAGPDGDGSASVSDAGVVSENNGSSCIFVSNCQEDTEP